MHAQSLVPVLSQPLPAQALSPGGPAVTVDVRNYISVPGVVGTQFAKFETVFGRFSVELRNDVAPRHVSNFLGYAQRGDYNNSFIHRSVTFDPPPGGPVSIVQGGGYRVPLPVQTITRQAPVALEYNLPNERGTLAAARLPDVNSATSEWFFNVRDNSTILNQSNGGGYTVFGRVLGTGMSVVDAIAALPRYRDQDPASVFQDLPLRNYTSGNPTEANLAIVNSITPATLFPTGGGASVIDLSVQNSAPAVVNAVLSGSTLTLIPVGPGSANITVRAQDANGNSAQGTFTVSVAATAPVFTAQPPSAQTAAVGSTVVFNAPASGAASYRWEKNGVAIQGASNATLVLSNVAAADAGSYRVFASNSFGTASSEPATLTVVQPDPVNVGRLVNLSILTTAGSGAKILTMGTVIGPGESAGGLPVVVRAVGPTLATPPFNVPGVLPDPQMSLFAAGAAAPLELNDNWGGSSVFSAAFESVGAFALPANSLDAAIVRPAPGLAPGGYTVQVTGKGNASGNVIAEIYDASGSTRTATTPRLINLSTLAQIDSNGNLAVGFVLGGTTARTVLIRGVGPSLSAFSVSGPMADPQLELFDNGTHQRIATNDDWSGNLDIRAAANGVAAFPLSGPGSKDAALLLSLPPGQYSAIISGVGGAGGTALVEVYEVR